MSSGKLSPFSERTCCRFMRIESDAAFIRWELEQRAGLIQPAMQLRGREPGT